MNTSEIKKQVTGFRREFGIREVTAESLGEAFRRQGFTVIEFNPVLNDQDVETVMNSQDQTPDKGRCGEWDV